MEESTAMVSLYSPLQMVGLIHWHPLWPIAVGSPLASHARSQLVDLTHLLLLIVWPATNGPFILSSSRCHHNILYLHPTTIPRGERLSCG